MKTNAATRLRAHKLNHEWTQGIRGNHAATGAIIVAADTGRCLLQHRSPYCDTPNTYGQFGGSIDGNEEVPQALRREIQEETGYAGKLLIRPLTPFRAEDKDFTYYNMAALVPKEFKPAINEESHGYVWFHPHEGWPAPLHPGLEWLRRNKFSMDCLTYMIENRQGLIRMRN